ncbi:hypothetical protein AGOR_G00238550 [Albula goreensis]|uniref:Uncharacterized protein n=1 Tax=Albula goreensis TaxID=1534307 RepID=A0A8T3CFZ8_9TELE|nr:hypothetical protein AGOR_G00238550 [Albula goreensis]
MRALWIGCRCNSGARAGLFSWLLVAVRRPLKYHSRSPLKLPFLFQAPGHSQPDMRHHSQMASPAQAQTPPARATSTHPSRTTTTPLGITEPEDRPEQSKGRCQHSSSLQLSMPPASAIIVTIKVGSPQLDQSSDVQ